MSTSLATYSIQLVLLRGREDERNLLLSFKKRCLVGGIYSPILNTCMKKILTMLMTLLTVAVSMSALGLAIHGGAEAGLAVN
ncbi:MAG: hypothetical protein WB706_00750 [Nitrososphaeraceae archaeon]